MFSVQPPGKKRKVNMDTSFDGVSSDESVAVQIECDSSPDMFADSSVSNINSSTEGGLDINNLEDGCPNNMERNQISEDHKHESCQWKGISISDLQNNSGCVWGHAQLPPIRASVGHTVLFKLPIEEGKPPASLPGPFKDIWNSDHVRMPFSPHSVYPVANKSDNSTILRSRWEMVQEALLKQILSSQQLETAILSYNSKYRKIWDFSVLHYFISEVLEEEEVDFFFNKVIPSMVRMALQLPTLITSPIPLLKRCKNHSISLSQLQIASLLCNAFFCTFPRRNATGRNSEFATFPDINFNRLFKIVKNKQNQRGVEKLKCLLHYFRRVCHKMPEGTVTFTRRYLQSKNLPLWEQSQTPLCKLHVTSEGTIENQGQGMLQMDFANKRVGGGVLGWGCVQEEIRFVICPELIISRLFTEALEPTEALIVVGCERYSSYTGYGDTFEWDGDYQDKTSRDSSGRLDCSIVAIDALSFRVPNSQYLPQHISRELNKAYTGFSNSEIPVSHLSPVATGNWGCGVFKGNTRLKSLLQLMAASEAGRNLVYFTFGDEELRDDFYQMYTFLKDHSITVGQLWRHLCSFNDQCNINGKLTEDLYPFLYQTLSKNDNFTLNKGYFPCVDSPKSSINQSSVKLKCNPKQANASVKLNQKDKFPFPKVRHFNKSPSSDKKIQQPVTEDDLYLEDIFNSDSSDSRKEVSRNQKSYLADSDIGVLLKEDFTEQECLAEEKTSIDDSNKKSSLLESLSRYDTDNNSKSMPSSKRKISDYFSSLPK